MKYSLGRLTRHSGGLPSLLVCISLLALAGLSSGTGVSLQDALDRNWRGAYDILVTSPAQDFGSAQTGGMVDASFISTAGEGGISVRQLEQIRAIPGVEVAAPIGMVGTLRNDSLSPALWVSDVVSGETTVLPKSRVVARVTMTLEDVRTEEPRVLARNVGHIGLESRSGSVDWSPEVLSAVGYPIGFAPLSNEQGFFVPLGQLPDFSASIIAIDPAAERELFGEEGRGFLRSLENAPQQRDLARSARAWMNQVDDVEFLGAWSDIAAMAEGVIPTRQAVPLVVSEKTEKALRMTVRIELASEMPDEVPVSDAAMRDFVEKAQFEPAHEISTDVSGITAPFSSPDLGALWPGSTLGDEGRFLFSEPSTDLLPTLLGRPAYEEFEGGATNTDLKVTPMNVVGPAGELSDDGSMMLHGGDPDVGQTRAYRSPVTPPGGYGFAQAAPAPLGTFDPHQLVDRDQAEVSYVPSGLQPTTPTTILGGADAGQEVLPSLSNLDFITASPGAFTDLAGGEALRGETPIDAVRVRVAGVTSYTADNQEKVADVAAQVAARGLTATVVAGSSAQPIAIYVPQYHVDREGAAGDLGWVTQEWTTLGAAVSVNEAVSDANRDLGTAATIAAGLGYVVASLLQARGLRHTVAVLTLLGWRRRRIVRYLVARQLPALTLILAAAGISALMAPSAARTGFAIVAGLAGLLTIATVRVSLSEPRSRQGTGRSSSSVQSVAAYATRRLGSAPLILGLSIGGGAVLTTIAALSTIALQDQLASAGRTRLAVAVLDTTMASIVTLGAVGAGAAILLLLTGRRLEMRQRAAQERVLVMIGFRASFRRAIVYREELLMTLMIVLTGVVVALLTHLIEPGRTWPISVVAIVATFVVLGRWATSSALPQEEAP